jgi:16S rRNA G966 N2-methylase RsmD
LKIRSLVLLSGERTTLPEAEAKSVFLAYDGASRFESPAPRVLISNTEADPFLVGSRVAFARRVGYLVEDSHEATPLLKGHKIRFRSFDLNPGKTAPNPEKYLKGIDAEVDLGHPELELTLIRGAEDYLAVTSPATMRQGWANRRPRVRRFFHPSAIFPKLSRALFNLSGCKEGEIFLDPFAGTGSIAIEAAETGARTICIDLAGKMVRGALANMKGFGHEWLGVVRADSSLLPLGRVDAIATDIPYGRASSTHGMSPSEIICRAMPAVSEAIRPGGFVVVMHPKDLPLRTGGKLVLEQEHHLYVHKLLTRTITVLRRR